MRDEIFGLTDNGNLSIPLPPSALARLSFLPFVVSSNFNSLKVESLHPHQL
jgi:hypothetical protein